uniref:Uncharacterized protein n=1 Tax=Pyrodinium bahamense TaxID=73915 RepID=A0A7S0FD64_9DINO|mmetsp:Transcript_22728/g.63195  ORF Transcript_22728/g.63195 Transcript_22728/m.63195 type:complete len:247 (+) Transcript_22728:117-857(+)
MLTVGLLTGFSHVSGVDYYRGINEKASQLVPKGDHMAQNPPMIVVSMDRSKYTNLLIKSQESNDYAEIKEWLLQGVQRLHQAGAEFLVISPPSAHLCYSSVREAWPGFPVLHIGDTTAVAIRSFGFKTVGLLGFEEGMRARLEAHGLHVLVLPDAVSKKGVDIFFAELVHGKMSEEAKAAFIGGCRDLFVAGGQAVVLGTPEIEALVQQRDVPDIPLICPVEHHVAAAANVAVGQAWVEDFAPPWS